MPKITKRFVEAIKPDKRDLFVWDTEVRGFGVRVKPSGVRSYLVQYRNRYGRSRRLTIGQHGRLTAEQARRQAKSGGRQDRTWSAAQNGAANRNSVAYTVALKASLSKQI